ncbi:MAG: hypothetical protein AVDCRST_MAG88-3433 [uncultured Thermomicrobiales bacterium]|uniref:Uncharacterized protein n=1 Tax=uncultured Thermomicrobiales bacterium TaxID=1645740 RepID=A0A6J4VLH2_9BACT|nr:MAG: hypothetical protein AVDCRST_MAG88-3433 [uncultured Thermomicrobiales bacterium]
MRSGLVARPTVRVIVPLIAAALSASKDHDVPVTSRAVSTPMRIRVTRDRGRGCGMGPSAARSEHPPGGLAVLLLYFAPRQGRCPAARGPVVATWLFRVVRCRASPAPPASIDHPPPLPIGR